MLKATAVDQRIRSQSGIAGWQRLVALQKRQPAWIRLTIN
jgi:hypothetical protein